MASEVDGILYHTVQFCDNFSYEYAALKGSVSLPLLELETDCTRQAEGQIRTRVQAFLESLSHGSAAGTERFTLTKKEDKPCFC